MSTSLKEIVLERIRNWVRGHLIHCLILFYLACVFSVLGVLSLIKDNLSADTFEQTVQPGEASQPQKESLIVEISGAVNRPGVYTLGKMDRLVELINQSGGFSSEASEEWVAKNLNLSAKLSDAEKVYIPYRWEWPGPDSGDWDIYTLVNNFAKVVPAESPPQVESGEVSKTDTAPSGKINVNTASTEDLDGLSGIGPVYAARMIENRPYDGLEDLTNNSGIPKNVIEKIKEQITF